jgi:annexin A7/11
MPPQGPPPGQYGAPVAGPSLGYVPGQLAHGWDATADANTLRGAMKGFGTRERPLVDVLSRVDPLQVNSLKQTYTQIHKGRNLEKDIDSETSRYFREGLLAIVRGPLLQDAFNVNQAVKGAGTNEDLLNHVVLGRQNADLRAIKQAYQAQYKSAMESDIAGDLSLKTKDLFRMVLSATRNEENVPVAPDSIERDVAELHRVIVGSGGQDSFCNIVASRSDGQLRAIAQTYEQRHRTPLRDAIKKKFDGHMRDALILMVDRAADPIMSDAVQLEAAMAGMGTKDRLLVNRVITVHWNRQHKDQVKRAYQHRYKKDLLQRIRGETSGDYRDLLVACMS